MGGADSLVLLEEKIQLTDSQMQQRCAVVGLNSPVLCAGGVLFPVTNHPIVASGVRWWV
jgi:hypothetical protein